MLDIKLKLKPGHTLEREWMKPSPLKTLFWNVTYACNYSCPLCFTDAGKPSPDELNTNEAYQAIEKIHAAGVHDLIISGGEPFLREDMVDILIKMADFGISARIASNGSLLNNEILQRLKNETLTKSFQISLDCAEPEIYQKFHGKTAAAFDEIIGRLRQIHKLQFHTTISVRLMPGTLAGIPGLLELAAKEDWSTVTIHIPVNTNRVRDGFPQETDFLSLLSPVFEAFCELPQHWLIETYIPWAQYHPVIDSLPPSLRVIHRGCRAGRDRLTINPTGNLSPCVCLDVPEAHVGNIRHDDLVDVFQKSEICDILRHPVAHGICTDCGNVMICGGGCRAAAFAMTQQLDADDMSCPVWKRRAGKKSQTFGHI